jgi:purine-binding chemotaxis protein CheW
MSSASQAEESTALFLTFRLGDELFALDVFQVREVLDVTSITRVPRAPGFMRGIINVRGTVVPVIDLRVKFGMDAAGRTRDSRIVVMELDLDGETALIGALADSVHEVVELETGQIEPPPGIGARWRVEMIRGIGKKDGEFVLLLDIGKVFSDDELDSISSSASAAAPAAGEGSGEGRFCP